MVKNARRSDDSNQLRVWLPECLKKCLFHLCCCGRPAAQEAGFRLVRSNLNYRLPYHNEYHRAEAIFASRILAGLLFCLAFNTSMFWTQALCTNMMDLPLGFSFGELGM